ncbi:hypothetical protein Metho_2683 (plasmid) [Methanomethylovorans hollandica DSM 15978]|jgi:hypothetical protein|uniref:Uncharacterized protein n=1 Tax=Methanomethylovorans hollandica (strain DSM 15978 / NBRC 107637 / DMS1) TaxID=867904 RepID=L0L346_METHD|nr:hypothetical protein [Methanomethylovorans hollandica]AGB50813.1 hypothetical protein Metho_2683 [Methanomethylovorans hollandica DSM 15978]
MDLDEIPKIYPIRIQPIIDNIDVFKELASNLKPEYFGIFLLCSLVALWLHFRRRT